MEDLEFNIFDEDVDENTNPLEQEEEESPSKENEEQEESKKETTEVNPDTIFDNDEENEEDSPESVGSEDSKNKENSTVTASGSSPKNTYSSIAAALKQDGVLLNLEDTDIDSINTPDDFAEVIEKEVTKRMDSAQRRIKDALDYGAEPKEVAQYEKTIQYLNSLDEDTISAEDENSTNLRRQLIFQDFVNRGFSQERAKREMEKSFNAGTDIEDAKEALESNKQYFNDSYNDIIQEAKTKSDNEKRAIQEQATKLKKAILESEKPYEGITLSKDRRQKIYDSITKVVAKTEDGRGLSLIQKYEQENPIEYKQKLAILFELTDGFKNIDTLVKGKSNKQNRKNIAELAHTLRNTPTYPDGKLKLANETEDSEATFRDLQLDI